MTSAAERPGVLIVTDVYPPDCGGSGWSAHSLVKTLASEGHRVEVMEIDPTGDDDARRYEGQTVRSIGTAAARRSPVRRLGANDYAFATVRERVTQRLLAAPELEVVHAQHLHSGPGAVAAARAVGRAAVITLRDHWPTCLHGTAWQGNKICPGCSAGRRVGCMREHFGWSRLLSAAMLPWAGRRLRARRAGVAAAHQVIAVSRALRDALRARRAEFPMRVVYNIVDGEEMRTRAATTESQVELPAQYLLAAGKLTATKGFAQLIDWLSGLEVPPLVIAGDGPDLEALRRRAASRGVDTRFLGWVGDAAMLKLMQNARAVMLPSRWEEPLSRVMIESMGLGTPVIAAPIASAIEVIDSGNDGWVAPDAETLRRAVCQLADPTCRDAVGAAASATARRLFSPQAVYPALLEVYREAEASAAADTSHG